MAVRTCSFTLLSVQDTKIYIVLIDKKKKFFGKNIELIMVTLTIDQGLILSFSISNETRVYGQFCIETLHESRKRNSSGLACLNRKTKCQNYRKISRN